MLHADEDSMESRLSFTNLTSLFHMFIKSKLFSHDRFVCTLISRGESFKNNLNDIKRPIQAIFNQTNIINANHHQSKQPSNQLSTIPTNIQQLTNNNNNSMHHSNSVQNIKFQSQKSLVISNTNDN